MLLRRCDAGSFHERRASCFIGCARRRRQSVESYKTFVRECQRRVRVAIARLMVGEYLHTEPCKRTQTAKQQGVKNTVLSFIIRHPMIPSSSSVNAPLSISASTSLPIPAATPPTPSSSSTISPWRRRLIFEPQTLRRTEQRRPERDKRQSLCIVCVRRTRQHRRSQSFLQHFQRRWKYDRF